MARLCLVSHTCEPSRRFGEVGDGDEEDEEEGDLDGEGESPAEDLVATTECIFDPVGECETYNVCDEVSSALDGGRGRLGRTEEELETQSCSPTSRWREFSSPDGYDTVESTRSKSGDNTSATHPGDVLFESLPSTTTPHRRVRDAP